MTDVIRQMLEKYGCRTSDDYKNALKEVVQEMALLGLSRTDFFNHAAFYGGSALRICHGLQRFSEDLDFSLLAVNKGFTISPYCNAIKNELNAFGLDMEVTRKNKSLSSAIESAFIKGETLRQLLTIRAIEPPVSGIHRNEILKIKLEIDIDPPGGAGYEIHYHLRPIPYSFKIFDPASLFAGKMHAVLCRSWQGKRVKGRDLYDLVWYIEKETPLNLFHLEERMKQTGHLDKSEALNHERLMSFCKKKFSAIDYKQARHDIEPFIKDPHQIDIWSEHFFNAIVTRIRVSDRTANSSPM